MLIYITPLHFEAFACIINALRNEFINDEVTSLGTATDALTESMEDALSNVEEVSLVYNGNVVNISATATVTVGSSFKSSYRANLRLYKTDNTYRVDSFRLRREAEGHETVVIKFEFSTCSYEVIEH